MKKTKSLIKIKTQKPNNCKIGIVLITDQFYKISLNQKQFDALNEEEKIPIYIYLNELQEKLNEKKIMNIIVKEEN